MKHQLKILKNLCPFICVLLIIACQPSTGFVAPQTATDSPPTNIAPEATQATPNFTATMSAYNTETAPCVKISVSNTTPKVGDLINVVGQAPFIHDPWDFSLHVKDFGGGKFLRMVNVIYDETRDIADVSQVLELVSAKPIFDGVEIALHAREAGSAQIYFYVSGENYCCCPVGSMTWGEYSEKITIEVAP
jgi:hypothetical protein